MMGRRLGGCRHVLCCAVLVLVLLAKIVYTEEKQRNFEVCGITEEGYKKGLWHLERWYCKHGDFDTE